MDTIELIQPDDFHLHVRDLPAMADIIQHTAKRFGRAVIMPNIKPAATSPELVEEYRERILAVLPGDSTFQPLMTLYLTASHTPADMEKIAGEKKIFGIKLYPAGATTHSDAGVSSIPQMYPVFEAMEKLGLPLLVHGEDPDPAIDIFDRERVFVEKHLAPMVREFPELRIVLEHVSSKEAVQFVKDAPESVGATVTVQHLSISRNDYLAGGMNPHAYCMPVVKTASDRDAIREAVFSGHPRFFAGTDSAPHPRSSKENGKASAGVFSAPAALEMYAAEFDGAGAMGKLESFLSKSGADFYGLPYNQNRIRLIKEPYQIPTTLPMGGAEVVPFRSGDTIPWRLAE